MALPKLKVHSPSGLGRDTRVWLDGHELTNGMTGLTLDFEVDDVNRAELRFLVGEVDVDADTLAALQAHVAAASGEQPVDLTGFGQHAKAVA